MYNLQTIATPFVSFYFPYYYLSFHVAQLLDRSFRLLVFTVFYLCVFCSVRIHRTHLCLLFVSLSYACVVFLLNNSCLSLFFLLVSMMFVFSMCKQHPRRSYHYSLCFIVYSLCSIVRCFILHGSLSFLIVCLVSFLFVLMFVCYYI